MKAPLFVLGVSRSGTTMLRVVLDRSPGIAIPDESFFVPLLARRHRGPLEPASFLDDLSRLSVLAEWGVTPEEVRGRLRPGMSTGEAIAAVFETYAAKAGKLRWGDKTPMYMRHLGLLERLFPEAQFVHLIRDGRDAAASFLTMPAGTYTRSWGHPTSAAGFACLWKTEISGARDLGARVGSGRYLETRYEQLVAEPTAVVMRICEFAAFPFEPAMLEYPGAVDVSRKPHQQRLRESPRPGARDWRRELGAEDARRFEEVAGDLLQALGYELSGPYTGGGARAALALARYRAAVAAWEGAAALVQRSPLWRRRHPPLTTRVAPRARERPSGAR